MKKWMQCSLGLWLLMAISCAAQIKLFIVSGQSNADGRGLNVDLISPYDQPQTNIQVWFDAAATDWVDLEPGLCYDSASQHGFELSLGKKLHDTWGGDIRLIKYARGGTSMVSSWAPGLSLYNTLVGVIEAATNSLSGQDYSLEGFLWMQGEADAKTSSAANAYESNLTNLISSLREHFSAPNMRAIIGRIQDDIPLATYVYANTIRTAQVAVGTNDVYANWVDTDTLALQGDDLHYTSAGYIDLGELMADSYGDLKEVQVSTNALAVPEGSTNTFIVRLALQPAATVTVSVTQVSGDRNLQVQSGASLTFTTGDWDSEQTVILSASSDIDSDNGAAVFHCTGPNGVAVVHVTEQDTAYLVPWTESFEVTQGALNAQHGWTAGDGAVVTNSDAQSGSQSLSVTEATATHIFEGQATNLWASFRAKLPGVASAPEQIPSDASAVFYVNTNNFLVAYSNTAPLTLSAEVSNVWNKIEVFCDYSSKVWNLKLNGELVVNNFAFYGSPSSFSALELRSASTEFSWFDEINLADTVDADDDGIPNEWEDTYFGGWTNANPTATASNGVNSLLDTYIAGIDPTDPDALFDLSDLQENVLFWSGVSGRVYTVYWTSNLLSGFQTLETNISWMGNTFTDATHSADNQGFYKIEVQLAD